MEASRQRHGKVPHGHSRQQHNHESWRDWRLVTAYLIIASFFRKKKEDYRIIKQSVSASLWETGSVYKTEFRTLDLQSIAGEFSSLRTSRLKNVIKKSANLLRCFFGENLLQGCATRQNKANLVLSLNKLVREPILAQGTNLPARSDLSLV